MPLSFNFFMNEKLFFKFPQQRILKIHVHITINYSLFFTNSAFNQKRTFSNFKFPIDVLQFRTKNKTRRVRESYTKY